ncbi:hypothetical protein [Pseudogemmobacter faecipullorum]|uniref:Uncharacterized protein n=1 Tax=Pseudogemmobacter faecipullorum TaxID=2755041 RepID=A0ABS8CRP2_9RHOB|nr:hypothetical protein [Pseudogemmobacter faecipullorum]MCB5412053.1 hypothetical protein [Pseudogemmobacter faecipullorum]
MKLLRIPEYHSLSAASDLGTVSVTVKIDGKPGMMPGITMEPSVLARLVEDFFSGALDFMSFDEHPKRLIGVSVTRKGKAPAVTISARSLLDEDGFPADWKIADPQPFEVAPLRGVMS